MKIYKLSSLNFFVGNLVWGIFSMAGIYFVRESPFLQILIAIFLFLLIVGSLILLSEKICLTKENIEVKSWQGKRSLKWDEITHASISFNPDFPTKPLFLYLSPREKKFQILIPLSSLRNQQNFFQDVLSCLPSETSIDPNLIGFAKEGKKYSRKLFFRQEFKTILWLLAITPILFFLTWLYLGFKFNYWHWQF